MVDVMAERRIDSVNKHFGRDILNMPSKLQRRTIRDAFTYWRNRGFPFPSLSQDEIKKEFYKVKKTNIREICKGDSIKSSTSGLRLANAFHPQMWKLTAHSHKKAPFDNFLDDEVLIKLIEKAPKFWPNRRCWNAQCLRSLFRIYAGGRVANFRPTAARAIIGTNSIRGAKVLDFCAGFGGRLLGSLTLNRHYIGVDPSPAQISGLKRMYNELLDFSVGSAEFHCGCAERLLLDFESEGVDLIFTSPPYFNVETYGREYNQSSILYKSYEEWKRSFLSVAINESHRLLRPGGLLVLNIANTITNTIAEDAVYIASKKFVLKNKMRLLMNALPAYRSGGQKMYRWEPVYFFLKR